MSKVYRTAVAALDALSTAELAALLGEVSVRLRAQINITEDEPADDSLDTQDISRRYLPRLPQMIAWGLVTPMKDALHVRDMPDHPALLIDASSVAYQGETMSLNDWAKQVTGWKAVNVFEWIVVKRTGRTLAELRRTYMDTNGLS